QLLLLFFADGPILGLASFTDTKQENFVPLLPTFDTNLRFLLLRIARRRFAYHLFPVVVLFELRQPGHPLRLAAGHQVVISAGANLFQVLVIGHASIYHHRRTWYLARSFLQTFQHLFYRAPVLAIALEHFVGFG